MHDSLGLLELWMDWFCRMARCWSKRYYQTMDLAPELCIGMLGGGLEQRVPISLEVEIWRCLSAWGTRSVFASCSAFPANSLTLETLFGPLIPIPIANRQKLKQPPRRCYPKRKVIFQPVFGAEYHFVKGFLQQMTLLLRWRSVATSFETRVFSSRNIRHGGDVMPSAAIPKAKGHCLMYCTIGEMILNGLFW